MTTIKQKHNLMKKTILATMTIGLLTFQSCSDKDKTTETQSQPSTSLAGKIYSSSDDIDTLKCERIAPGTDYWQTLVFVDDSVFVKIINTCCGGDEEDFASAFYYSGKYKMDDKTLALTFDPKQAVYYSKTTQDKKNDTLWTTTAHVELEKSDITTDNLDRFNCNSVPYFKQKTGDFKGETLALDNETTLENCIKNLKDEKVWDKLFSQK